MSMDLSQETQRVVIPIAVLVAAFLTSIVARKLLLARLSGWAKRTQIGLDDIMLAPLRIPSVIWCLMLAIYVALEASAVSPKVYTISLKTLFALAVISITLVVANLTGRMIARYMRSTSAVLPVTSLTQNIVRFVILLLGALVLLNGFGISVTPILGALGVGGLAVALALQDTLGNFFAGFYVAIAGNIRIGDYIKLDSGDEGVISDIGWRATKIKTGQNNMTIIPNTKLANAIVTNFNLPGTESVVVVSLGVSYDSDLAKVENVTIEIAKDVMKAVKGGVAKFEPILRYSSFGDSDIKFDVVMCAERLGDSQLIKHEFIKRLHKRYGEAKITIR